MNWEYQKSYHPEKTLDHLPIVVYRVNYATVFTDWYDMQCIISWLEDSPRVNSAAWEVYPLDYLHHARRALCVSLTVCKL